MNQSLLLLIHITTKKMHLILELPHIMFREKFLYLREVLALGEEVEEDLVALVGLIVLGIQDGNHM